MENTRNKYESLNCILFGGIGMKSVIALSI